MILFLVVALVLIFLALYFLERTFHLGIPEYIETHLPNISPFWRWETLIVVIGILFVGFLACLLLALLLWMTGLPHLMVAIFSAVISVPFWFAAAQPLRKREDINLGDRTEWIFILWLSSSIALGCTVNAILWAYQFFFVVPPS